MDSPAAEPGLVGLCNEIRSIVENEASIIGEVFPHPSTVVQVFLQRIFLQSVSPFPITANISQDPKSP